MELFSVSHTDGLARRGVLHLPHGEVQTPVFMPVGTVGTMKAIHHDRMEELNYKLILGNTYHLYLRPGLDLLAEQGGLHGFSTWPYNFLTDSGGFQFFSLAPFCKFSDEGVKFRSHIDGSYHFFSPESAIDAQNTIGSNIKMVLDVCTPPDITEKKAYQAHLRTTDWAKRCYTRWQETGASGHLFGIVQGNFFKDIRTLSASALSEIDFPGFAIGGLSVGESKEVFTEFVQFTTPLLPLAKPKYVMGIGTPDYILEAIEAGVDMFDCVYPTRVARNGAAMTADGLLNMKSERFKNDKTPIEEGCTCMACRRYSRAYIRHLVRAKEVNAITLITDHNLTFMQRFISSIHTAIETGTFNTFKAGFMARYYTPQ